MHAAPGATHRLFFALWPDAAVRSAIASRAAETHAGSAPAGRPVPPRRYHLTLQFLGSFAGVPDAVIDAAIAAGDAVQVAEFTLVLDRLGSFERSRVWWFGCDVSSGLRHLHGELQHSLVTAGVAVDAAPFVPHVTLGRGLRQRLHPQAIEPLAWPLRDFVLVDSADGATDYRILRRWPLAPLSPGSRSPDAR